MVDPGLVVVVGVVVVVGCGVVVDEVEGGARVVGGTMQLLSPVNPDRRKVTIHR